ncbi:MAG: hypothetical protein L6R42_002302 [Xanthoria sp. 1 TBL-2021]|nr:MAG: hypothetical protein L6R42_002302 [Xanthoria sp. 1 TBL-2021]
MAGTQSSVKDVIPDIGGNFALDEGVIEVLPLGSRVLSASSFGSSAWTRTARIRVQLPDGSAKQYFLKCATEGGQVMMEGEFNSMTELHKLAPSFVPQPHAWGKFYLASPVTHFFLCEFIDMENEMPDPVAFCARLAEIHLNSQSPTGQFGFAVPNCHGKIVQSNDWDPSWTSFFTKLLVSFFKTEIGINGPWPEYEQAFEVIVKTVVPQLLDPLQASGRVLKPSLVHGDLWEENAAINLSTGEPVVFDASAFYAHNEYELGTWRRETIKFGRSHFNQYLRNIPPSEPVEQWDDRVRLYSLKFNLAHMIGWPGAPFVRAEYVSLRCLVGSMDLG